MADKDQIRRILNENVQQTVQEAVVGNGLISDDVADIIRDSALSIEFLSVDYGSDGLMIMLGSDDLIDDPEERDQLKDQLRGTGLGSSADRIAVTGKVPISNPRTASTSIHFEYNV